MEFVWCVLIFLCLINIALCSVEIILRVRKKRYERDRGRPNRERLDEK